MIGQAAVSTADIRNKGFDQRFSNSMKQVMVQWDKHSICIYP